MNLSTLKSLQSRIREATGADRELDALIAAAFLGGEAYHMPDGYAGFRWVRRDPVDNAVFETERYTRNPDGLGACVALQMAVLPGSVRDVEMARKLPRVTIWTHHDIVWQGRIAGEHALETHAHLLAIIGAKIAELEAQQQKATWDHANGGGVNT